MEATVADKEKAAAFQAFVDRRAANKGRPRIDNSELPAGSPMYFYCAPCGGEIEVEEDYIPPRPKYCTECQQLETKGWLQEFVTQAQKNS